MEKLCDDFWLWYLGRLWCHLLRWIDENRLWQQVILGANEGGLKFTFWCTRFEMFIRYPNGNVKQAGGYTQIYKSELCIYINMSLYINTSFEVIYTCGNHYYVFKPVWNT